MFSITGAQAQGIFAYTQAKLPDKGYNVDDVMSEPVNCDRGSEYAKEGFSATVAEILKISGKSTRTLHRMLSLINLPEGIRMAISEGTLPVSQGYLFAANLDSPDLEKIFQDIMKTPVTKPVLEKLFSAYKQKP